MSEKGRPAYIPREHFREWMPASRMARWFRVDGIQPASYVGRSDRLGCPVKHQLGPEGQRLHRALDIVAHGRGRGYEITESHEQSVARKLTAAEERLREVEQSIGEKQHVLEQSVLSESVTDAYMLSPAQVIEQSHPYDGLCGVYFLIADGEIVYVGQSVNVGARMAAHRNSGKEFDRYAWISCPAEQLDVMESLYIHVFRPPLNITAQGVPAAPLSLRQIAGMAARDPVYRARGRRRDA